jgi:S1-C subfamily serine protease
MVRKFIAAGAAVGLVVVLLAGLDRKEPEDRPENVTVRVVIPNRGHGSGVFVKSGPLGTFILTNLHVCAAARDSLTNRMVNFNIEYKNRVFVGQVWTVADNSDLCLIKIVESGLPVARIARMAGVFNQRVQTLGNPGSRVGYGADGRVGGRN